jgi:hypothetical protein
MMFDRTTRTDRTAFHNNFPYRELIVNTGSNGSTGSKTQYGI